MQWNSEGDSLVFLYRIGLCRGSGLDKTQQATYVFTVDGDGQNLWRMPVVQGGRHSYGQHGILLVCDPSGVFIVQNRQEVRLLAANEKPSYQGDGAWVVVVVA